MVEWFPYIEDLYYTSPQKQKSLGSLYLSRVNIEKYISMNASDERRASKMKEEGIIAIIFKDARNPKLSEERLIMNSVLWATGLKVPDRGK